MFYIGNGANLSIAEKVQKIFLALGGLQKFVRPGSLVLIKPNFVAPFPHATTTFEVLEAIVREVKNCKGEPVIAESSGFEFDTETTFRVLGAYEFAKRNDVELVNLDKSKFTKIKLKSGFFGEVEISELVHQANIIINVPKLKKHTLTKVTIGVKNLFGLLSRESRRKIHAINLERGIYELSQIIKPDLVIVDGSVIGSRAVYGEYEELGIIVGGTDPFAVDMFCCRFLQANYREVGHLKMALDKGIVREDFKCINLLNENEESSTPRPLTVEPDSLAHKLHQLIYQLLYFVDIPYSKLFRGKSIIPLMHFYFGIRPHLDKRKCTDCGDCVTICPVNAIKIPHRSIDADLCTPVRCMKCIPACPENAISAKGRNIQYV